MFGLKLAPPPSTTEVQTSERPMSAKNLRWCVRYVLVRSAAG